MAAGGDEGTISLWSTERWDFRIQHRLARLLEHRGLIWSLTFSRDGTQLVTGDDDGNLQLWDVATNVPVGKPIPAAEGKIFRQVFDPKGRVLALAGHGFVTLWDFFAGESLGRIQHGERQHIPAVAFSPDGRILATGGMDATIRLWDVETRQLIAPSLHGHKTTVLSIAFSPDGKLLASKGGQNKVRIWDVDVAQWHRAACGIVNRNLSLLEWERFLGSALSYCRICPELPSGDGAPEDAPQCTEWN